MQNTIPADVVLELIGCVSFSKNQDKDVEIAENIASNSYHSMTYLCDIIEGFITGDKQLKNFKKFRKSIFDGNEPFFKPYIN